VIRRSPPAAPALSAAAAAAVRSTSTLLPQAAAPVVLEINPSGITVRVQGQQLIINSSSATAHAAQTPLPPWLLGFVAGGTCSAALSAALFYSGGSLHPNQAASLSHRLDPAAAPQWRPLGCAAAGGGGGDVDQAPQEQQQQQQQQQRTLGWVEPTSLFGSWGSAKAAGLPAATSKPAGVSNGSSGMLALPCPWLDEQASPHQPGSSPPTSSSSSSANNSSSSFSILPDVSTSGLTIGTGGGTGGGASSSSQHPTTGVTGVNGSASPHSAAPGDGALMRSSISKAAAAVAPAVVHIVVSDPVDFARCGGRPVDPR